MKNKKKNKYGMVYSTNPDFEFEYKNDQTETITNKMQNLKIYVDKHRSGKTAVIIKNFIGNTDNLKSLSKMLKTKCGVGGSAKNGEIIIQGNVRNKVIDILKIEGYNYKIVGG
tara:strand:+ start:656 stop:994 length:339 start_codon:yes stop_codon:yes gene_type:complete